MKTRSSADDPARPARRAAVWVAQPAGGAGAVGPVLGHGILKRARLCEASVRFVPSAPKPNDRVLDFRRESATRPRCSSRGVCASSTKHGDESVDPCRLSPVARRLPFQGCYRQVVVWNETRPEPRLSERAGDARGRGHAAGALGGGGRWALSLGLLSAGRDVRAASCRNRNRCPRRPAAPPRGGLRAGSRSLFNSVAWRVTSSRGHI